MVSKMLRFFEKKAFTGIKTTFVVFFGIFVRELFLEVLSTFLKHKTTQVASLYDKNTQGKIK